MNRNRKFCLLLMIVAIGLCTIAAILDLNTEKSSEMSFSWAQSSITLKPTESIDVVFTNPSDVAVQLTVVDISAPAELVPYIVATPSTIPENSQQTVTIQFIRVPTSVLNNIVPDTYSVRIGDLLVYLDMNTAPPENVPENTENIWLMIDNLNQRIETLENQRLADNILLENQRAMIALLENQHPENLPENFVKTQIDNLRAYIDTAMPRQQFLIETEITKAKGDAGSTALEYTAIGVVIAIVGVIVLLKLSSQSKLGFLKVIAPGEEVPTKLSEQDKNARLKNRIEAILGMPIDLLAEKLDIALADKSVIKEPAQKPKTDTEKKNRLPRLEIKVRKKEEKPASELEEPSNESPTGKEEEL